MLLVVLLLPIPVIRAQDASTPIETHLAQFEFGKFGSTKRHYPGTRWWGNTKQRKFMSETEARAQGYRPAMNGQ